MTNQPRDLFSDVACVPYWNDTFIQAEVGEWFRLVFTEDASGSSAPVTMRLTNMGEDADCERCRGRSAGSQNTRELSGFEGKTQDSEPETLPGRSTRRKGPQVSI